MKSNNQLIKAIRILLLAEDEEGNIQIGTNDGSQVKFNGTHFTKIIDQDGFYCNWDETIISEKT